MNVLGVVGSPRRGGNTHLLVSKTLEGAREKGASTELVLLGDLDIRECDGCHACWKGRPCPKADAMNALYPKIAAAGALVLGTPVYWYGPTALMKAFIDRFVYFNAPPHRAEVRGKRAALLIPFEDADRATAKPVVDFFRRSLRYLEMEVAGALLVPGVTRRGEVARKPDVLRKALRIGRSLA